MEMRQGFSMRQSVEQKHHLDQGVRLTYEQRLRAETLQLSLQRDLVEEIHGRRFVPKAECGKCGHELSDMEIMNGFNQDPSDFTTACPKCQSRFFPTLFSSGVGSITTPYYCPMQTLDQLVALKEMRPDYFRVHALAIYNSAIIHFGGLAQAFKRIGIIYAFEEKTEWMNKVITFLGKMPDTVIAGLVHTSAYQIRKLRKAHHIERYHFRQDVQ